jgi:hypothetical protein
LDIPFCDNFAVKVHNLSGDSMIDAGIFDGETWSSNPVRLGLEKSWSL